MSTEPTQRPMATLQEMLDRARPTIAKSLAGSVLTADRLIQVAFNCVSRTPDLQKCSAVSIVRALIQSAELGLEPGTALQEAWLVPYNNRKTGLVECQFQPGYRGLARLAIDEAIVLKIDCIPVYEQDEFTWNDKVLPPVPKHKPAPLSCKDRGGIIGCYCVVQLPNGGQKIEVMTRAEIDHIRGKSKAQGGPWDTDFAEMAKKTVWKRTSKLLGIRPESKMAKALEVEDVIDSGFADSLELVPGMVHEDGPVPAPVSSLAAVTANLKAKRGKDRPAENAKEAKPAATSENPDGPRPEDGPGPCSIGSDCMRPNGHEGTCDNG